MAGQMSKHKINIGLTSLILIFIILCLATFSLLSLSSARGDQSLAARSARAVTEYYRADAEGEKWLKQADAILQKEMTKKAMDQEEIQALAKKMALAVMEMRKQALSVRIFPWTGDRHFILIWLLREMKTDTK